MSRSHSGGSFLAMSEAARKEFACPTASGVVDDIDLGLLDRDDEDQRRIIIEAEHPELKQALDEDIDEVRHGSAVMSPGLHIAMHEIVTNQLWADTPPEMWETAERLTAAGYARHDVLHMLGSVVSGQVWQAMVDGAPLRHRAGALGTGGLARELGSPARAAAPGAQPRPGPQTGTGSPSPVGLLGLLQAAGPANRASCRLRRWPSVARLIFLYGHGSGSRRRSWSS